MNGHKPIIVANELIDVALRNGHELTHLQLQKLLYFAHGHCLAEYGVPLIEGTFVAWPYGPVHLNVYREFKEYDDEMVVPHRRIGFRQPGFFELDRDIKVKRLIQRVIDQYGGWTAEELVSESHVAGGPWDEINQDGGVTTTLKTPIPNERIKLFFLKNVPALAPLAT